MSWLKRERTGIKSKKEPRPDVPEGLWTKCAGCGEALFQSVLEENLWTCPHCDHHFRIPAASYIKLLTDPDSFAERFAGLEAGDPLQFRDARMAYPDRLKNAQRETGMRDAAIAGTATIGGKPVSLAVMDFFFMGGSMGSVVGEKVARSIEVAIAERRALIVVSSTGGARMQEGILSLMQMAKTSALLVRLQNEQLPFVSILTDPSTAGVLASFASLGDVIFAEPKALVGFAGARVIRQTIGEDLPPGFQRAEFVLEKGFVDRIVHRKRMREDAGALLEFFWRSTRGFARASEASPHAYQPFELPAEAANPGRIPDAVTLKLQSALETLYGLERRRDKLGLSGTRALLRALGHPERRFQTVHVAGTNGKGSVCAMIERGLREAGVRTGLYTSPHLVDFRERIRVGGRWADAGELEARLEHIEGLPAGRNRTFFEVTTALAFDYFAGHDVEWAVVEVGLGGRLDSTNVLPPGVTVVTAVSLDHTEILGGSLARIAAEKAGVIKPGATVILGPQSRSVRRLLAGVARERGATVVHVDAPLDAADAPALHGVHQRENAAVARAVLRTLRGRGVPLDENAIAKALRGVRWPGRLESCPGEPRLWWDGAHNPRAIEALGASWRAGGARAAPIVVLALSRDKDERRIARLLAKHFTPREAMATRTRNPRAMPPERVAAALAAAGFRVSLEPDVPAAIRTALARDPAREVLVTGSLFAVGEAMERFGGAPGEWL